MGAAMTNLFVLHTRGGEATLIAQLPTVQTGAPRRRQIPIVQTGAPRRRLLLCCLTCAYCFRRWRRVACVQRSVCFSGFCLHELGISHLCIPSRREGRFQCLQLTEPANSVIARL